MTSAPPATPSAPGDPRYLTVISTTARLAAIYFAVMAVALVVGLVVLRGGTAGAARSRTSLAKA